MTNGYKLFQGIVTKSDDKGDRGFSWSDVEIRGTKEFEGHTYKVFVKNENNVTWLDGKPDAMAPDFIANLDPKTGDTINPPVLGSYIVERGSRAGRLAELATCGARRRASRSSVRATSGSTSTTCRSSSCRRPGRSSRSSRASSRAEVRRPTGTEQPGAVRDGCCVVLGVIRRL